jgi:TPR repeat protein
MTTREYLPTIVSTQGLALLPQGESLVSRGLTALRVRQDAFDEEIYQKAKPRFLEIAEPFMHASIAYKEFVRLFFRAVIEVFGEGVKPYAIRFSKECEAKFEQRDRRKATRPKPKAIDPDMQHERYREARVLFNHETAFRNWRVDGNPAIAAAFSTFQQLADEGYQKAYYPLSVLYRSVQQSETGQSRSERMAQLAFECCLTRQADEDVELWCDLGDMYKNGHGVAQDPEQAEVWFRKAAETGDTRGQWSLGLSQYNCDNGEGQKNALAFDWMRRAAAQGDAFLQSWLGEFYEMNARDEDAVYWYSQSALQGNSDGQYKLGLMYEEGRGVAQNLQQAMFWYRKAAEQGHAEAQWQLGRIFEYGY